MDAKVKMIPMIDACDMPSDVEDYCVEREIQTHYQNDVAFVKDDGNVFAKWLKELGVEFTSTGYDDTLCCRVAILST